MNPLFVLRFNGRDKLGYVTNPTIYYLRASRWQLLCARGRLNWLYCRIMKGSMRFPTVWSAQGFGAKALDSNSINWLGIRYDKVPCIWGTHSGCAGAWLRETPAVQFYLIRPHRCVSLIHLYKHKIRIVFKGFFFLLVHIVNVSPLLSMVSTDVFCKGVLSDKNIKSLQKQTLIHW